jgi:hypothetical protein
MRRAYELKDRSGRVLEVFEANTAGEALAYGDRRGGLVTTLPRDSRPSTRTHEATAATRVLTELTLLSERAIKADGSALIKIIAPGWGSSGHYSREMLERDGAKAFPSGTKMYLDHPTKTEERERPERSVTDLAAETTGPAAYREGPQGHGLYAPAKVFTAHRQMLEDLAPHIGVSIRALGRTAAKPVTTEGRTGPAIEELVSAKSVDFVTEPGAGGAIVSLFESARAGKPYERQPQARRSTTMTQRSTRTREAATAGELSDSEKAEAIRDALVEFVKTLPGAPEDPWAIVIDVYPDHVIFTTNIDNDGDSDTYALAYSIGADGTVKFKGDPIEVAQKRSWEPVVDADDDTHSQADPQGTGRNAGRPRRPEESRREVARAAATSLTESFKALGLTEKMAARAMRGRPGSATDRALQPTDAARSLEESLRDLGIKDDAALRGRYGQPDLRRGR